MGALCAGILPTLSLVFLFDVQTDIWRSGGDRAGLAGRSGRVFADLTPFWVPFWDQFGSPVRHYTVFGSPWGAWVGIVSRFKQSSSSSSLTSPNQLKPD